MARDPSELYDLVPDLPELGEVVLVQALDGFVDAGGAKRLAREHLLATHGARVLATFDVDRLLDYRARRPVMTFAEDHWADYDDPSLAVHLAHDADGTPFLVLAGPEPDVHWELFIAAVASLVDRLGVHLTVGLNSIPMAVPHTRPLGIIAHATRPELVAGLREVGRQRAGARERRPPARIPPRARPAATPPASPWRCPTTSPTRPTPRPR